ncbi:MAG: family 20 glycosylhydrolase, partial [Acidobacteriaceae bacterium]|nr:family 20 glycosylhydrolase [Acidobacteriaceae bacterium]
MCKLGTISLVTAMALNAQWRTMPMPAGIVPGQGRLVITQQFRISIEGVKDARVEDAAARALARVSGITGMPVPAPGAPPARNAALILRAQTAGQPVQMLGEDESYRLQVNSQQATITAQNPLGVLHGMETFLQLIENDQNGWSVPAVTIDDRPRFPWRGLHLDVSRHFMPIEVVKRNLDGMAAVKLNVFHWHL